MDSLSTAVAVILIATSCALSGCFSEEHLVPKHGLESTHRTMKRDLSDADMEMILKALMLKLEHKEPEVHYSGVKESEMKYASKGHPVEYEYVKESLPYETSGYEMKKDTDIEEKDMKAFSMKLKELGIVKDVEESYGKEAYLETPEDKFMAEEVHLITDPGLKEQSKKAFEDALKDKFSDKDVSIAESLYHMKIAGDIETYPHIKMEPLHDMKMADEKLHLEKVGAQETFLKKVDELSKTLLKEEHLKDSDIEAYLKKVAEEEKTHLYEPEIAHESHIKNSEEKALDSWKTTHKDIFIADKEFLDEKLKKEAAQHKEEGVAVGMNEDLIKKIKLFDEELAKEHDELLHTLSGKAHKDEITAEASTAYEKAKEQAHRDAHFHLTEEEMKKHIEEALAFGIKEKAVNTDLLFGKGLSEEKAHGIDAKVGTGIEKSLHGVIGEEALKSKEVHALDKAHGFEMESAKFGGKVPLMEGEFKHILSHDIAGKAGKGFKIHDEELLKEEVVHGVDTLLHKGHEDELLKKEKALGIDAFQRKAFEDELIKKGEELGKDAFLHKAHEEDLLKEKSYSAEDFFHKAHDEEILKAEKGHEADILLHKAHDDELLKKEKAFDVDAFLHKAHEDELLKEKAFDVDSDLHKAHEDELIKKEIAYGTDALFHKDKDILTSAEDHHVHHEKSHKTIKDLKAKFFELLRRVLHTRKCHLVTMRPVELLGIVNCISRSKDPLVCEKFAMCEKKKPARVIAALEKCQKETIPGEVKTCTKYAPLYPSTEIPLKIFQCVAINTRELVPEERKKMIEFEECARAVKAESCGRFKFLPH